MKKILKIILTSIFVILTVAIIIDLQVIISTKKQIIKDYNENTFKDVDCIIVLGAGIWQNRPSPMLEARLDEGIKLYEKGAAPKIIMSGDHANDDYDEVNIMKNYAISKGVPSEDIFMDHAGISTYDSIYRAKNIFGEKKVIIVTQKYHLYRALYIANELELDAFGVNSDPKKYKKVMYREIREILARNKDFIKSKIKPESTYMGDPIPVSGNGNITNDK